MPKYTKKQLADLIIGKLRRNFVKLKALTGRINGFFAENMSGMRIVQIFRKEKGLPEPEEKEEERKTEQAEKPEEPTVDVAVTDESKTMEEQKEDVAETASEETTEEPGQEEPPQTDDTSKSGSVGRFSNGRIE